MAVIIDSHRKDRAGELGLSWIDQTVAETQVAEYL
jgi:hypothetical protein